MDNGASHHYKFISSFLRLAVFHVPDDFGNLLSVCPPWYLTSNIPHLDAMNTENIPFPASSGFRTEFVMCWRKLLFRLSALFDNIDMWDNLRQGRSPPSSGYSTLTHVIQERRRLHTSACFALRIVCRD